MTLSITGRTRTMDEHLLTLKNRLGFKMYFPDKPREVGINIITLCNSKSTQCTNLKIQTDRSGKNNTVK